MSTIPQHNRSDTLEEKIQLLQDASAAGNYDLAMSLTESIKDTLALARQTDTSSERMDLTSDHSALVKDLAAPWADWARGWAYYKSLVLFEEVGLARAHEPVDLRVGFRADQLSDPVREVRVARLDEGAGVLEEVPSQVHDELRHAGERSCRLLFFADVPLHGSATYLIFYGNPHAERPDYGSGLTVRGEGYGLDVINEHYVASLSRQMGQLERLRYRREHALELYAGGKGHGEPPTIDWAHDYVDEGNFQKMRVKNWARCPNFQVVQGPLCVQVRRWGFPHSPVHPLFTPSRIHMDMTYRFYAGLPYFFKETRMDVLKDQRISALRDDEWVFSGYTFTDLVWMDEAGKLHEGPVPAEQSERLWGAGFYHRESRDAFITLWLEHRAQGIDDFRHNGAPTLNYHGHGQLYSRGPLGEATLKPGTSLWQKNAYLVFPYAPQGAASEIEKLRHRLMNPLELRAAERLSVERPQRAGMLARPGETAETGALKNAIWKALREVKDEQLYTADANVVDMGYVYDVQVRAGRVRVLVTMPHRGRPVYDFLVFAGGGRISEGIRERLLKLDGVRDVTVDFTWDPPWTVARLTDAGRKAMGLL